MTTLIILIAIGLLAGVLSGFIGIGGGVIIVPALVYFLGMRQLEAQGTSLAVMLPPIGAFAVINYYKGGYVDIRSAVLLSLGFIVGGYIGSKFAISLPENVIRKTFGCIVILIALKIIFQK